MGTVPSTTLATVHLSTMVNFSTSLPDGFWLPALLTNLYLSYCFSPEPEPPLPDPDLFFPLLLVGLDASLVLW